MKSVTWKYSDDNGNSASEFECYETEIHRAAEEIAAEMDAQAAAYPDERTIDVWCPVQKRWHPPKNKREVAKILGWDVK